MKTFLAVVLLLCGGGSFAQSAYPEPEAAAAWRGLAASYVRKAIRDQTLEKDPAINSRVDAVMAAVGAAVAVFEPRYAHTLWRAILIEDFGHGAAAFPGQTILVDAKFVRNLQLNDHELALIFAHEAAHVLAGHAAAKLSFMAEVLGKEKVPDARTALMEFMATDSYAAVFLPTARLHEREADTLGAAIFFASGYDSQQALLLFDKLARFETHNAARDTDSHDAAMVRKQAVSQVFGELQRIKALGSPKPR